MQSNTLTNKEQTAMTGGKDRLADEQVYGEGCGGPGRQ